MTNPTVVRDQAGLDAAVAAGARQVRIDSPRGVWIDVRTPPDVEVRAYDSSTVRAGCGSGVHLHSRHARITGGVLIDHTAIDLDDVPTWLDYKGVTVTDGMATLYKAVDADLNAGHRYTLTAYPIGGTVTAPDWNPRQVCGAGLHFSPAPHLAAGYYNGDGQPRFLEVLVPVDGLVLLDDKVKARSCTVVREVTVTGAPVAVTA